MPRPRTPIPSIDSSSVPGVPRSYGMARLAGCIRLPRCTTLRHAYFPTMIKTIQGDGIPPRTAYPGLMMPVRSLGPEGGGHDRWVSTHCAVSHPLSCREATMTGLDKVGARAKETRALIVPYLTVIRSLRTPAFQPLILLLYPCSLTDVGFHAVGNPILWSSETHRCWRV